MCEEAKTAFNYFMEDWLGSTEALVRVIKESAEDEGFSYEDFLVYKASRAMLNDK